MIRKVIKINEELCNGCGLCANACHEGAIGMIDGKAKLLRDDYCDGLGNCLPVCPTGAITFEEREAAEFDEVAVEKHMKEKQEVKIESADKNPSMQKQQNDPKPFCGCPSTVAKTFDRSSSHSESNAAPATESGSCCSTKQPEFESNVSNLMQWPVQIQLAPVNAPYFNGAHLLIAADCAAFAHPSFNQTFMKNKITIIGCPKLDDTNYAEKLTLILSKNNIKSVTVVRMEVPCCGGIVAATIEALKNSGKMIPWSVVKLSTDGNILED